MAALGVMKWNNSESVAKLTTIGSTAGYVEFKDEDLGIPANIKRWYGVRMSYMSHGTPTQLHKNTTVTYVLDGGTTMITTGVPTDHLDSGSAVIGDDVVLTAIQSCQSVKVRLELDSVSGIYDLRDIGLELRPIHRRVT